MKNLLLALLGFIGAAIFTFPNLIVFIGVILAVYNKYVSALFCLIFAWNIARFVQSKYEQSLKD